MPLSAYQGKAYSDDDMASAREDFSPWLIDVTEIPTDETPPSGVPAPSGDRAIDAALAALLAGEIIGWYDGRAEVGADSVRTRK